MLDWRFLLNMRPRFCPHCGATNFRTARYCHDCGERIRGGNLLVRFAVTIAGLAVLIGVIWYKVFR